MELTTESHRAEIRSDGLLIVWHNSTPAIRETKSNSQGGVDVRIVDESNAEDESMQKLIAGMSRMPYFAAAYGGEGDWHCDIDAGFQRCRKTESGVIIGKALRQCGFGDKEVSQIMKLCRKSHHSFIPWRAH